MHDIHLDIETVPAQDQAVLAELAAEHEQTLEAWSQRLRDQLANVSAPSNWKDPDKIQAYVEEQRLKVTAKAEAERDQLTAQADERYRKTALDGARGQICVISWAIDDGPIQHVYQDPTGQAAEADEPGMLRAFFEQLPDFMTAPRWVGHNILGFDLRFIFQRCVINGVRPTVGLQQSAPPHSAHVFDTMLEWAGYRGRVSESALCKALGIADKGSELAGTDAEGIDGSQVWDYVSAGRLADVVTYCDGDVDRSRRIFKALTFAGVSHG